MPPICHHYTSFFTRSYKVLNVYIRFSFLKKPYKSAFEKFYIRSYKVMSESNSIYEPRGVRSNATIKKEHVIHDFDMVLKLQQL